MKEKYEIMKKRVVPILLAFVMALICFPLINCTEAYAIGYYGANLDSTNYSSSNPFKNYWGQCTWYAWGRALEKTGTALPCRGNAKTWISAATSTTPRANSVAVWTDGTYGHVAFVEAVENGLLYITEANRGNAGTYSEGIIRLSDGYYTPSFEGKTGAYYCGLPNGYIYCGSINKQPIGWLDVASGGSGKLYVKGWAFDPDEPTKQLSIDIYVGGAAGSGANYYRITANKKRQDVDDVYHCGAYHGFERTLYIPEFGSKQIYAYALDTQGGENPNISGSPIKTTITADKKKPLISNVKVSNISSTGYTVTCDVSDNGAVKKVTFPTWTTNNGQDDIFTDWGDSAKGTISNGKVTYRVKTSEHNREAGCKYITHIYADDYAGNSTNVSAGEIEVPSPISNVEVKDIDSSGYTVTCDVDTDWGVKSLQFPTWSIKNGQDDLIWHTGTISKGKGFYRVQTKDHGNAVCEEYLTHIYVWDNNGHASSVSAGGVMVHNLKKIDAVAATCSENGSQKYYMCTICEKCFSDVKGRTEISKNNYVIPATGNHIWDSGNVTKAATTSAAGIKTYTCTICGKTTTKTIPKLKVNPLAIKVSSKSYTFATKARSFTVGATKAQGKVTYTPDKAAKTAKITASAAGKVTVPAKCPVGTYKITVKAAGNATYAAGTKIVTVKVTKAANPLTIKVANKTYKNAKLKKAATFTIGATKAQGKVTYTLNAAAKKVKIKVTTKGKVTVPKKCKKGTYKITVKAVGNKNYKAGVKTVKIVIN